MEMKMLVSNGGLLVGSMHRGFLNELLINT